MRAHRNMWSSILLSFSFLVFMAAVLDLYASDVAQCSDYFPGYCPYGSCTGNYFISEWPCKIKGCTVQPGYVVCMTSPQR